jgi:hypothetical protein
MSGKFNCVFLDYAPIGARTKLGVASWYLPQEQLSQIETGGGRFSDQSQVCRSTMSLIWNAL